MCEILRVQVNIIQLSVWVQPQSFFRWRDFKLVLAAWNVPEILTSLYRLLQWLGEVGNKQQNLFLLWRSQLLMLRGCLQERQAWVSPESGWRVQQGLSHTRKCSTTESMAPGLLSACQMCSRFWDLKTKKELETHWLMFSFWLVRKKQELTMRILCSKSQRQWMAKLRAKQELMSLSMAP